MVDWQIVLSRDGTVLDATDGAPRSWVGTRLVDRDDVSEELKQAGRAALDWANHDALPASAPVSAPMESAVVHLAVVDAVPLRRTPTNIRSLLRSSLEVLRRQAEVFDIALRVSVEHDVPGTVPLDRSKIAWAITALVGNALRYVRHGSQTMTGGSISVRAAYDAVAHEIAIEVQDDGLGIPADRLRSLFGGAAEAPGLALGLTMVRDVVAAHGGTVNIESETAGLSRGTTVRFTLPAVG